MSEYQLTASEEPCAVIREKDGACIPPDMANTDYNCVDPFRPGYIQWKEAGGTPDPYVEPPEPEAPPPTQEQQVLFDHENRVRALEGQPPLSTEDFVEQTAQLGRAKYTQPPAAPRRQGPAVPKPTKKG